MEITPTLKKQILLLKQNRVRYQNPDEKNKNRIFIIEKQNNFKETNSNNKQLSVEIDAGSVSVEF